MERVELGSQLQGVDYVYTVQGWLKAMNHADKTRDPGQDAVKGTFAPDAFGMTIEYFSGDYTRGSTNISSLPTGNADYFDGQIRAMSWQTKKTAADVTAQGAAIENPTTYAYQYDQKYELTQATWGSPNFATNVFTVSSTNAYQELGATYDAHGNLLTMQRKNAAGTLTDNFAYTYLSPTTNNRLGNVSGYGRSYGYDAMGQLTSETGGAFAKYLTYDASGLVSKVHSDVAKSQLKVSFDYDEAGQRVKKVNSTTGITTYYVRDGAGNVMAIYEGTNLKEFPVYASGRLGEYFSTSATTGNYQYELSDHLGNVRAVMNAAKLSGNLVDLVNYTDYYAFGSTARAGGTGYRYGYQGQYAEKDRADETDWNSFELRMYDARIGRFMSIDAYGQYYSPYIGMGNNPVNQTDPDGGFSGGPGGEILTGAYAGAYVAEATVIHGSRAAVFTMSLELTMTAARLSLSQPASVNSPNIERAGLLSTEHRPLATGAVEPFYMGNAISGTVEAGAELSRGNYTQAALSAASVILPFVKIGKVVPKLGARTTKYRFSSISNRWHGPDGKFITPPTADEMRIVATGNGLTISNVTNAGFETWSDGAGVARMKIKPASTSAGLHPNSMKPRVTIWDASGQRVDGWGRPVLKKSVTAHAPLTF